MPLVLLYSWRMGFGVRQTRYRWHYTEQR